MREFWGVTCPMIYSIQATIREPCTVKNRGKSPIGGRCRFGAFQDDSVSPMSEVSGPERPLSAHISDLHGKRL